MKANREDKGNLVSLQQCNPVVYALYGTVGDLWRKEISFYGLYENGEYAFFDLGEDGLRECKELDNFYAYEDPSITKYLETKNEKATKPADK